MSPFLSRFDVLRNATGVAPSWSKLLVGRSGRQGIVEAIHRSTNHAPGDAQRVLRPFERLTDVVLEVAFDNVSVSDEVECVVGDDLIERMCAGLSDGCSAFEQGLRAVQSSFMLASSKRRPPAGGSLKELRPYARKARVVVVEHVDWNGPVPLPIGAAASISQHSCVGRSVVQSPALFSSLVRDTEERRGTSKGGTSKGQAVEGVNPDRDDALRRFPSQVFYYEDAQQAYRIANPLVKVADSVRHFLNANLVLQVISPVVRNRVLKWDRMPGPFMIDSRRLADAQYRFGQIMRAAGIRVGGRRTHGGRPSLAESLLADSGIGAESDDCSGRASRVGTDAGSAEQTELEVADAYLSNRTLGKFAFDGGQALIGSCPWEDGLYLCYQSGDLHRGRSLRFQARPLSRRAEDATLFLCGPIMMKRNRASAWADDVSGVEDVVHDVLSGSMWDIEHRDRMARSPALAAATNRVSAAMVRSGCCAGEAHALLSPGTAALDDWQGRVRNIQEHLDPGGRIFCASFPKDGDRRLLDIGQGRTKKDDRDEERNVILRGIISHDRR